MRTNPPVWAEAILRLFLASDVFLSVSGDLLEQYRDSVLPVRGPARADGWYLRQVLGFALRKTLPWAALFGGALVTRFALDMLHPTTDFHTRSLVTTYTSIGLLLAAGFWTAWRSGSFFAGAAAGFAIVAAASILSMSGTALLLVIWHDPIAMSGIAASGGLDEAFLLPAILIVPGSVLGGIGGVAGAGARRLSRAT
jgi:hypothetical protein